MVGSHLLIDYLSVFYLILLSGFFVLVYLIIIFGKFLKHKVRNDTELLEKMDTVIRLLQQSDKESQL